jgi:hypothetical protein
MELGQTPHPHKKDECVHITAGREANLDDLSLNVKSSGNGNDLR